MVYMLYLCMITMNQLITCSLHFEKSTKQLLHIKIVLGLAVAVTVSALHGQCFVAINSW